jgi:predicted house-cleaning noncanonical NTP pyrophosphatase (MazG superfamily)
MAESIIYNKLVRDKIPEIIESSGKTCEMEILSDEEYLQMLDKKLDEELAEYHQEQNIEELADLLEVLYATAKAKGYSIEELDHVRIEKQKARGGFDKKILLKSVNSD